MKESLSNANAYFAAANGYDGFRSNFDNVFSPKKVKKLFILKGGPGTGKSTLMRKIADEFESDVKVTRIFCSSDPKSLDGVLLMRDGISVAIADGTSPHVIEPKYPGAVEEIVNLGDGFNYMALSACADKIFELSRLKRNAYARAYSALRAAGAVKGYIDIIFRDFGVYKKAECVVEDFVKDEKYVASEPVNSNFLISAFSKDGHTHIPYKPLGKRVVHISGDGISEYCIMQTIAERLMSSSAIQRLFSAPFSAQMYDAIETNDTVYTACDGGGADDEICLSLSNVYGYLDIKKSYDALLSKAQNEFAEASSYHFELEDIYSGNISFEMNENKKIRIIKEIKKVFCK